MDVADWMLRPGDTTVSGPLAVLDLASWPLDLALPDAPLVGLGNRDHPLAGRLDAVIETPASLAGVIRQVMRAPLAATAALRLLRAIDGLDPTAGLVLESMCYGMLQGSGEHRVWQAGRPRSVAGAAGRVLVTRRDDVLHVTLDRPSARNAIDRSMRDALHAAFTLAGLDPDIRGIRLRSVGAAFSVGADLAEFGTTRDPATADAIRQRTLPALALAGCPGLLEVHVQGACIGAALEMAAFARRITAAPGAWFQLPELAMGIIPGAGGCVALPRRIGRQRTALMLLSGQRINAATALSWGLVDAIVETATIDENCADMLGR